MQSSMHNLLTSTLFIDVMQISLNLQNWYSTSWGWEGHLDSSVFCISVSLQLDLWSLHNLERCKQCGERRRLYFLFLPISSLVPHALEPPILPFFASNALPVSWAPLAYFTCNSGVAWKTLKETFWYIFWEEGGLELRWCYYQLLCAVCVSVWPSMLA